MMLVKAGNGEGVWELYQVHDDLRFCGANNLVEVPVINDPWPDGTERLGIRADSSQRHLPDAEVTHVILTQPLGDRDNALMRWVAWRNAEGIMHRLLTDQPVFILNADGQTVEALR